MRPEFRTAVYARAIARYGDENQMVVAIEELSEVQKELCKILRDRGDVDHLAEEIADANIMLQQLTIIFSLNRRVQEFMDQKTTRLKEQLEE